MPPFDWRNLLRVDETPVRRRSLMTPDVGTPGTPADKTGTPAPLGIIRPTDVAIAKYGRRFRRLLGIGSASPLDGVVSDLVATVLLGQLNPEDLYSEELLWGGTAQAVAGAGRSVLHLRNPAANKTVVTLEAAEFVRLNTAGAIFYGLRPAAAPIGSFPGTGRDTRIQVTSGSATTQVHLDTDNGTAGVPTSFSIIGRAWSGVSVTPGRLLKEIVVFPGFEVAVCPTIDAEGVEATFAWRERPLVEFGT